MKMLKVLIKKLHEDAVIPSYAKEGDAAVDLHFLDSHYDDRGRLVVQTGVAVKIPEGYVGLIFPRSSISKKHLSLSNSVGVIDSGYTGEILVKFSPTPHFTITENHDNYDEDFLSFGKGDRVAQLIILPYPSILFEEVEVLPNTERGSGGFGSSGK